MAFLGPRRARIREKAPFQNELLVRTAAQAHCTREVRRYLLPCRAGAALGFPALSSLPGASPAHAVRCFELGNKLMSVPDSASTAADDVSLTPGIVFASACCAARGAMSLRTASSVSAM